MLRCHRGPVVLTLLQQLTSGLACQLGAIAILSGAVLRHHDYMLRLQVRARTSPREYEDCCNSSRSLRALVWVVAPLCKAC
jgi:hypothetical protein